MKTIDLFRAGLKELDISCSAGQMTTFMTFLAELKKWNKAYSLTALKTDEDIIIKHFLDSLLYIKAVPGAVSRLADFGTGAGFPGIPIKIVKPEIDVTLVESSRKKTAFLRHIIRLLQLPAINVLEQRVESLGTEHEKRYDVIVSRATFTMREFMTLACDYVKAQGRLVLNKGPKISEELQDLDNSPSTKKKVKKILKLQLPFTKAQRNLVVLACENTDNT